MQALLASLCSSGVQPTLELRQGLDGSCLWQATLQTSSFAVHAVAEAGAAPSMGESVLGPGLTAAQVASIEGCSPCGGGGLGLDVRWCQQGVAPPGSMDALWAAAAQDPGAACWPRLVLALRHALRWFAAEFVMGTPCGHCACCCLPQTCAALLQTAYRSTQQCVSSSLLVQRCW